MPCARSAGESPLRRSRSVSSLGEREAALGEVLRVIGRSPENLDASLASVADTAARLCQADFSQVWLRQGEYLVLGPNAGPAEGEGIFRPGTRRGPIADLLGPSGRAVFTSRTVHMDDTEQSFEERGTPAEYL